MSDTAALPRRIGTALLCLVVASFALVALTRNSSYAGSFPRQCATSVSPYHGAQVRLVWSYRGIALREYRKRGLAPIFVATADVARALPEPILPSRISVRANAKALIMHSRAAIGVNGDFFRIGGDGTANGPEVVGGRVVKGTSRVQNVVVTTRAGRITYGQLRVVVDLLHGARHYVGSGINDNSAPRNGLTVFTRAWGPVQPMHTSGAWREYIVNHGVVVAAHRYATRARIPVGGYVVEASGTSAVNLQTQGWRVGAHVAMRTYIRSNVRGIWAAVGAGPRIIHQGHADWAACGYDKPTARTAVGVFAGGRRTALVATSNGRGLTEREMAAFLRGIGLTEAMAFDGGGSSALATHAHRWTVPRYGTDRGIPNGFGFFPR